MAAFRRRVLAAVTRVVAAVRPLALPTVWEVLLAVRSAAGSGPVVSVPIAGRALVLAPHPDDETLGCGGTVALMSARGSHVSVTIASSGGLSTAAPGLSRERVAELRREEATAACRLLGAGPPHFLDLPDGGLAGEVDRLAAEISDRLEEVRPGVIFVPWVLDGHPDHQALAVALARVDVAPECEIWCYEVWAPLPANRITDITSVWDTKAAALDCHQTGRQTFDLDAHLALSRWRSIFALEGTGHAEAFLALRADQYRALAGGAP